jgi:replicative DNA helicase
VDLKESGSIENDADKVLFVHRDGYFLERSEPPLSDHEAHYEWEKEMRAMRNRVEVIVAKNRMGRPGTVELWIDIATDLVLSDVSELARGEVIPMRGMAE